MKIFMWPFHESDWRTSYRRLSARELLNRIRDGDTKAIHYLMETYMPVALAFAKERLQNKSEGVGEPTILAHDVLLCLWTRASTEGADMLNHNNDPIVNWLRKTVFYYVLNADRKEQKFLRDETDVDDSDEPIESFLAQIPDPDAVHFDVASDKQVFPIVEEALAAYPKGKPLLENLVRKRWMEGLTWEETAAFLFRMYPGHDPVLNYDYVYKSFWHATHKTPFFTLLRKFLRRYGYGF
ncbi:hypothetical protein GCM10028808_39560 [Spirosoma migulaei]